MSAHKAKVKRCPDCGHKVANHRSEWVWGEPTGCGAYVYAGAHWCECQRRRVGFTGSLR